MFESDKTILAVYKSLDDENSGARGNEMQTAGNRKYRQQKVQLEAAARSRWITEKSGCWVGAHGLERRSCGWVAAQQWRQSDRAAAGSCTACGEHSLIKE